MNAIVEDLLEADPNDLLMELEWYRGKRREAEGRTAIVESLLELKGYEPRPNAPKKRGNKPERDPPWGKA